MIEGMNRTDDLRRRLAAIDRDLLYERAIQDGAPTETGRAVIAALEQQRVLIAQSLRSLQRRPSGPSAGLAPAHNVSPFRSAFSAQNPPKWAWLAIPAILFFASLIYLAAPSVPPGPSLPAVFATISPVASAHPPATSTPFVTLPTAALSVRTVSTTTPTSHPLVATRTPQIWTATTAPTSTSTPDVAATALARLSESTTQTVVAQSTEQAAKARAAATATRQAEQRQQQARASATAGALVSVNATAQAEAASAQASATAKPISPTPLPLVGGCDPNGSKDGRVTPSAGPAGTNFQATLFGFAPREQVRYWYTSPSGQIYTLNVALPISGAGTARLIITTKGLQPGRWTLTVQGLKSNHASVVIYCIVP